MSSSPTYRDAAGSFHEIPSAGLPCGRTRRAPRSARLPGFIGCRKDAEAAFDELDLAVVGAGSVGRRVALGAARLQPRTLWIVDPSRFKEESLLCHEILPGDIGSFKATSTAVACKTISPGTRVLSFVGAIQELSQVALAEASMVVTACDNLNCEVAIGQMCLSLGVPLALASLHGDSLVAQVRLFANRAAAGPCPACGFGSAEWVHLRRESIFRCGGPAEQPQARANVLPTMSTAFLCSLAADFALTQVARHILGLGRPVADTLLNYCGFTHQASVSALSRNSRCPCEHVVWRRVPAAGELAGSSLRQLASAAGFDSRSLPRDLSFAVGDLSFVEFARCCGMSRPVRRFRAPGETLGRCGDCGGELRGEPFFEHRIVPASAVDLDAPLGRLGAPSADFAVVRGARRAFLLRS